MTLRGQSEVSRKHVFALFALISNIGANLTRTIRASGMLEKCTYKTFWVHLSVQDIF